MSDIHPATPLGSPPACPVLLCDNPEVMGSLLRALSDPGNITPRAPMESLVSWQRRAVLDHAAPHIQAADRDRLAAELASLRAERDALARDLAVRIGERDAAREERDGTSRIVAEHMRTCHPPVDPQCPAGRVTDDGQMIWYCRNRVGHPIPHKAQNGHEWIDSSRQHVAVAESWIPPEPQS